MKEVGEEGVGNGYVVRPSRMSSDHIIMLQLEVDFVHAYVFSHVSSRDDAPITPPAEDLTKEEKGQGQNNQEQTYPSRTAS